MTPAPAFQQWLHSVRALDWSPHRRQRSALQAFALLQQTCVRSYQHSASPSGEPAGGPTTTRSSTRTGQHADR